MPELPLDETQWGYVASGVLPTSHYKQTYMDPAEKKRRTDLALKALKEGRFDDHMLEGFERRHGIDNEEEGGSEFECIDEEGEVV
jgi:hypothetical protein